MQFSFGITHRLLLSGILFCIMADASGNQITPPVTAIYTTPNGDDYNYVFVPIAATWHQADQLCAQNNLQLASITTPEIQNFLELTIETLGYEDDTFWIAGNDLANNGNYYWLRDTPFNYTNWGTSQPVTNAVDNCVLLSNQTGAYKWANDDCLSQYFVICEIFRKFEILVSDRFRILTSTDLENTYYIPNYKMDFQTGEDFCRVNGLSIASAFTPSEIPFILTEISRLGLANEKFWVLNEEECQSCDKSRNSRTFYSNNDCTKIEFNSQGQQVASPNACQQGLYVICEKPL